MTPNVFNTHIHLPPNYSAFGSVDEAIGQAVSEGCVLLGTSNYYDFEVYQPFAESARANGIYPTFGIEILCRDAKAAEEGVRYNDPGNPGKVYLCGKGLTRWQNPPVEAQAILDTIRREDSRRIAEMCQRMRAIFGEHGANGPTADEIRQDVADEAGVPVTTVVLQERHVAEAYWNKCGAATFDVTGERLDVEPGFDFPGYVRSSLMKAGRRAFVPETYISLEEGIRLVRALGGIPAYPLVVDGMNPVSQVERSLPILIARLKDAGIEWAEFIPNRNSAAALEEYVIGLWDVGFPVTAGTEHNTKGRLSLQPRCKDGSPIPEAVQSVFWQSACILAAHENGVEADRETMRRKGEETIWTIAS